MFSHAAAVFTSDLKRSDLIYEAEDCDNPVVDCILATMHSLIGLCQCGTIHTAGLARYSSGLSCDRSRVQYPFPTQPGWGLIEPPSLCG